MVETHPSIANASPPSPVTRAFNGEIPGGTAGRGWVHAFAVNKCQSCCESAAWRLPKAPKAQESARVNLFGLGVSCKAQLYRIYSYSTWHILEFSCMIQWQFHNRFICAQSHCFPKLQLASAPPHTLDGLGVKKWE